MKRSIENHSIDLVRLKVGIDLCKSNYSSIKYSKTLKFRRDGVFSVLLLLFAVCSSSLVHQSKPVSFMQIARGSVSFLCLSAAWSCVTNLFCEPQTLSGVRTYNHFLLSFPFLNVSVPGEVMTQSFSFTCLANKMNRKLNYNCILALSE